MTSKEKNDLFYLCSLIEYLGRKTCNKRGTIVKALGEKGVRKLLQDAEVNHCLSFEQVSDEVVEDYNITDGVFDTITNCKYSIPGYQDIGKLYCILIEKCAKDGEEVTELIKLFSSFISDAISDFKTGVYYQNPSYLKACYETGELLD